MLQALPNWPNVMSVGSRPGQGAANGSVNGAVSESRLSKLDQAVRRKAVGAQTLLSGHLEALWHAYKPLTRPDKELLER